LSRGVGIRETRGRGHYHLWIKKYDYDSSGIPIKGLGLNHNKHVVTNHVEINSYLYHPQAKAMKEIQ